MEVFKKCLHCKEIKPDESFNYKEIDWDRNGGFYIGWCDGCRSDMPTKARLTWKVAMQRLRYEKKGLDTGSLTPKEWFEILLGSKGHCAYCEQFIGFKNLTLDHIVSLASGGKNDADNVTTACHSCNSRKSKRSLDEWKRIKSAA